MIEHMSCDERFIALAKELGYDIYGENTAGGHYAPLVRHHDELYVSGLVPRMNGKMQYPGQSRAGAQPDGCAIGRQYQRDARAGADRRCHWFAG